MDVNQIHRYLASLLGDARVIVDEDRLKEINHDFWLIDLQRRIHGESGPLPVCVVKPANRAEISAILAFASKNHIPVVPYGAGSGVCGGARSSEGAIVIDLRSMNSILSVNETALTVTAQPGVMGIDLETWLNDRGYSMGHFPQSIKLSSVGGWVATRASGQFSTKYGSIEGMLVSLKGVLACGTVFDTKDIPRAATGPDVNQLFLGSEGTLAIITEVVFKIHPLPEKQAGSAIHFTQFFCGLEAIRRILRAGWKPALLRLYDQTETKRNFNLKQGGCLLLLGSEGPAKLVEAELESCIEIATKAGGTNTGPRPVAEWKSKRFDVHDVEDLARNKGVIFDTIEVAANWDHIYDVYEAAIANLQKVPGILVASAHSSHSYEQGTCLYFTFAIKKPYWMARQVTRHMSPLRRHGFASPRDLEIIEERYQDGWRAVMDATLANQGTISHHHGVGKVRLPWIEDNLGTSYPILLAIKQALDPESILNPGTLFKRDHI